MLISKRIKWLSLQCLVILSLSKNVFGTGLSSCNIDPTNNDACKSQELNSYCINTTSKKIYKLTKTEGSDGTCTEETSGINIYNTSGTDVISSVTGSTKALIYNCDATNGCEKVTSEYIMITIGSEKKLFSCGSDECTVATPAKGFYLNSEKIDTTSGTVYTGLIEFSGTALSSKDTLEGTFVDASSGTASGNEILYSKLITCDSDKKCTSSAATLGYFKNGGVSASATNKLENALIECTGSTVKCRIISPSANSLYVENSNNGNLIQCSTAGGCVVLNKTDNSSFFGAQNSDDKYYINSGTSANATDKKYLIKCDSSKCSEVEGVDGSIYLNGNLKSSTNTNGITDQLIICNATGCRTELKDFSATDDQSKVEYFINTGKYTDANSNNYLLIKCSYATSVTKCEAEKVTLPTGVTELIYVNSNYGEDTTNYLINCTANQCDPYASTDFKGKKVTESTKEYYVNGGASSSSLDNAIIEVTFKASSTKRDGKSFTAKVDLVTPAAGYMYINSSDKKLIQCSTTSTVCSSASDAKMVGSSGSPIYYVNGDPATEDENFTDLLIKCEGTCTPTNGKENGVLINGNFKHSTNNANGEDNKRLIVCSEKKCGTINDASTTDTYYVNADSIKTDYSDALILCSKTTTDACSLESKDNIDNNNVYLNGNFKDSSNASSPFSDATNYLIICSGGTCAVAEGKTSSGEAYYVNAGHSDTTVLKDSLIQCTTTSCAVLPLDSKIDGTSITELFYINANYGTGKDTAKYIIKCQSATAGCTAEGTTSPTATDVEHYVHGGQTDFTDAVIEVTFSTASSGKKRATKTIVATPKFAENVVAGSIYINTSTKKLIQCSTDETATPKKNSCAAFDGTGTADVPGYYVNSAVSTANDYDRLLILCNGTECDEEEAVENGIYLNANLYDSSTNANGMKEVPLIICSESSCLPSNSNLVEDNTTEYFINSGKNVSGGKTNALIKCTQASGAITCTANLVVLKTNDPKNVFYINGNYAKDGNYLIQCSAEDNCSLYVSADYSGDNVTTTTTEHYVYGAANGLTDAIIEVTFTSGGKRAMTAVPTIITATAQTIYINSATHKLIQCTASACEAFSGAGGVKTPVYYKNAAVKEKSSTFTDALIKCNGTTCELQDGDLNEVYLNGNLKGFQGNSASNDANQLIVCSDGECNGTASGLAAEGYEFYINAGEYNDGTVDYPLIKCTYASSAATCVQEKVTMGDSDELYYINGNYNNDASQKRDSVYYLIKCTSVSDCSPYVSSAEEAGKVHYVHGAPDKLKEAVIECELTDADEGFDGSCTLIAEATANNIYINGARNTQIIRCTADACLAANTSPTDKKSEYYMNSVDTTKSSLIKCTKSSGCQVEELTEDDSKIFINANYGSDKDEDNQLIKCPEGVCELQESGATETPEFYVNGDETNPDYLKGKGGIIKCIKGESDVTCTEENASNNNVYLNANYDVSSKQIILCKETDDDPDDDVDERGCNEVSVEIEADFKYYVNSGSVNSEKLTDTLIKCSDSSSACEIYDGVNESEIYINANTEQLIYCSSAKGCEAKDSQANKDNNEFYLNASDLNNSEEVLTNDLIRCVETDDKTKKCEPFTGKADFVYIDSYTKGNIIYCTDGNGCKSKASFTVDEKINGLPKFYVNGDEIDFDDEGKDKDPLNGDLIKCTKTGTEKESKINCVITKGDDNNVYINSNYSKDDGDANNQLIICTEKEGCLAKPCSSTTQEDAIEVEKREEELDAAEEEPNNSSTKFPIYYINSGNPGKLENGIIQCTAVDEACTPQTAKPTQVYKNANDNETLKPIIKCGNNNCKTSESAATENNNEYYKNAGDDGETPLVYDIIECSNENDVVTCTELESINEGVYLNSNYVETGDNEQLIQGSKDNGCAGLRSDSKDGEYYVNAEASSITNSIILCINKKCEKQTPTSIPSFYVGFMKDEVDGLIQCTSKEEACEFKTAFTSTQGYYLNDGYNKSQNQTILCDSSEGCAALKVDLGYYVNAGESDKPIIKCEKEGTECVSEESSVCPDSKDAVPGNYCYEDSQLKFYTATNSTSISASKSDDIYSFAIIPDGGFPGIKRETGSLFKISRLYINRFYQSGIIMIDKNGKLVDNLSSDQSDINLYDCNDSTKICTERAGCTSNTYMFDSENKKAVFCNSGKLEYAEFTGYVVDSNRSVGTNHPYIIKCDNKICKSIRPKSNSYYENSGYDSTTNALIQCTNNNCVPVSAEVGYYVGHDGEGIIQCTSTTSCAFTAAKTKVKYVNSGSNKSSNAIISCSKNGCSAVKANIGYYLTYSSTLLIQCTSPSSCVEFTPTVNYYDNADTSESSNSIINCVQSSQVINCALEATNNGFYMSSAPNVLIRCKSGSKCKTVTVKNGIFRGAIKGLLGGSKRSVEETVNEPREEEVELEEDGTSVAMPRDSDDAYGIIRCVAGKCSALTASEIASIPVCEFNNNKCYITLEYAMTKSATTSITAGNICTNSDRSIFYFATDTIVVKPNVISGVTATYVFTTTNSNCLEVNDSYTDMYFTVGSNIFILDQGSVLQFYEQGYYFINTAKNSLVSGNDIDAYNDENVKLYKCNGSSCSITDKPDAITYYADINKRIIRYNINSDSYSFAYDKDITCIFANNKCTPNADLKNQEFCITYKGELALAKQDIKNRETGECYKAGSITNNIYGYSQYLYSMNLYSAKMIDETGYYIVSLSTNTTVVSKNYKTKNNNLVVYGCQLSSCKEYTPDENIYYYDARANNILRYKDGIWSSPSSSGYAYISIDPTNTYIYKFTKNLDEIKINAMANYGYYYTVDGEMYHCDRGEDGECSPISNTGYYFTNAGEVYYCVHDSEEIEPTECTKQACVSGQYYFIDDAYYRCESSSTLVPVMSRYCSYNENVIINFPLALTEEFPDKIKQAMEGIEKNNNSTAIVSRRGKNFLEAVSGIFTNCTYNVEETKSTFDLVCVNNFVSIDENTDDVKICSMEQLGYVECIEDEENPEKCNISYGISKVSLSIISIVITTILSILFINHY